MRTRGMFLLVVTLAGGAALSAAGCAGPALGAPGTARWAQPSDPVPASGAPASGSAASAPSTSRPLSPQGSRSAAPTPTRAPAGGWPPWCKVADLRFATEAGTGGGSLVSGGVLLTNVSGHPCSLGTYLILRWRDAQGSVVPLTVAHVNGPVPPPITFVSQPGSTAIAPLRWNRYQSLNSTQTCPPYPVTLDVWLPPTVEDPDPAQGTSGHAAWVTGDNASMCQGTVQLQPIERLP